MPSYATPQGRLVLSGGGYTGPLDLVTGATFARCVSHLLRAAYTGPLVKLREDAGNTTRDFYPTANGRLDTDAVEAWRTSTGATNLYGHTGYDQSGNGFDVVQATTTKQPLYVKDGGPGGTPSLRFMATDDSLGNDTLLDTVPAALTLYTVFAPRAGAGAERFLFLKQNVTYQDRVLWSLFTDNKVRLFTEGGDLGNRTAFSGAATVLDTLYLATGQYIPGSALQVWLNGTAGAAGDVADAIGNGTAENFFDGNSFTEVLAAQSDVPLQLIYPAAHDASQRATLWASISSMYGVSF